LLSFSILKLLFTDSPFDVGFEALGQIVATGSSVPKEKIGQYVIYTQYGAFAEYVEISQRAVIPIPVN
jgi:NADPH:quinone reductase-like Zn-dependent oxidoreductase